MIRTVEAMIDEQGSVLLREAIALSVPHRALVTILEEEPHANDTALLSEADSGLESARPPRQFGCGRHLLSGAGVSIYDLLATPIDDVFSEYMTDPAANVSETGEL